ETRDLPLRLVAHQNHPLVARVAGPSIVAGKNHGETVSYGAASVAISIALGFRRVARSGGATHVDRDRSPTRGTRSNRPRRLHVQKEPPGREALGGVTPGFGLCVRAAGLGLENAPR